MARPKLSVTSPPVEQPPNDTLTQFETLADARAVKREWVLPGRIAAGSLAILEGDTSVGKTTMLAGIAAAVTTGAPFLGRSGQSPAEVLWLSSEGDAAVDIRPLVEAAGGWIGSVRIPSRDDYGERRRLNFPSCITQLRDLMAGTKIRLVIVEPLMSHVSEGYDIENGPDARAILDPVQRLAMATGVTFLLARGLRKDRHGPRTLHGAGSATVGDTVRSIMVIDQPDRTSNQRYLVGVKSPGGALAPTMAYCITPANGAVVMSDWRSLSPTEALAAEVSADPMDRSALSDAEALLRAALKDGPVSAATVKRLAESAMISSSTLFRARERLGVVSVRHGFGDASHCEWSAPPGGFCGINGAVPTTVKSMEPMRKPRKKRTGKSIDSIDSKDRGTQP